MLLTLIYLKKTYYITIYIFFFFLGKSALQVSKKFNIPSRTLYDKVKFFLDVMIFKENIKKKLHSLHGILFPIRF